MLVTVRSGGARILRFGARSYAAEKAPETLKKTALYQLHVDAGAKMVPFAGWSMPVQYKEGVLKEHQHTREKAGLFDVSHMGQLKLMGKDRVAFIERLVPGLIKELKSGKARLSVYTNEKGGTIDDTVITAMDDHLYIVVNAGCADKDIAHFEKHLGLANNMDVGLELMKNHSLLALQGPTAAASLAKHLDDASVLTGFEFMSGRNLKVGKHKVHVTRCGYTGEDGFEISVPSEEAGDLAKLLMKDGEVKWIGLGARDSLRLEAGLCLYGHELNEDISPVEANLNFVIGKRRRQEGGFLGSDVILKQLKDGPSKLRMGLYVDGAPARENVDIYDSKGEKKIGWTTSGGPMPTVKRNCALAYIETPFAKEGTKVAVKGRRGMQEATVTAPQFYQTKYYRAPAAPKVAKAAPK